MTYLKTLGISALFASVAVAHAHAHASLATSEAAAESYFLLTAQIPHGCDGKATTELGIKLPEGFILAKPMPKAGWDLEVVNGDYGKTYSDHGKEIKSGPLEILWKGGNLPDEHFDTFSVRGKIAGVETGAALPIVITQKCGADAAVVWDEIAAEGADPHSLAHPAPLLRIIDADGHHGHVMPAGHAMTHDMTAQHLNGQEMTGAAMGADAKVGDIAISGAYSRAMLPGQPVGGGFLTIRNDGDEADTLVSVSTPLAGRVELHEMAMQGDVMKMRKLEGGIAVPAGETVELKPGGLHLMFMEVKKPFAEGDEVPVTLTFEKAGTVEMKMKVGPARGKPAH